MIAETALPGLLVRFYGRVRQDAELGPVFNDAISDWPYHLEKIAAFWSSVMLHSRNYHGNPMALHLKHAPRIMPAMFDRWLALWKQTTDEMLPPEAAAEMQAKAGRIAESLQLGLRFRPTAPQWEPLSA
jgi:hemoglobin